MLTAVSRLANGTGRGCRGTSGGTSLPLRKVCVTWLLVQSARRASTKAVLSPQSGSPMPASAASLAAPSGAGWLVGAVRIGSSAATDVLVPGGGSGAADGGGKGWAAANASPSPDAPIWRA